MEVTIFLKNIKMKKVIITIGLSCIAMMFLNGCVEDQKASEIRAENRQNITKINLGMTKAEVVQIMGDKTAQISFGKKTVTFTNPYKSEVVCRQEKWHSIVS